MVFRSSCLHETLKGPVVHYLEGPFTFWHPTDDFGSTSIQNQVESGGFSAQQWVSYLACVEVCWRWEKVTFVLPMRSNWAVMDPSRNLVFANTKHALSRPSVPSAASTASPPQQFLACRRSPLVDLASAVSRYLRTSQPFFPRHLPAAHIKTWTRRPFMFSIWGSGLKNT